MNTATQNKFLAIHSLIIKEHASVPCMFFTYLATVKVAPLEALLPVDTVALEWTSKV